MRNDKENQTVKVFGSNIPKWRDCPECDAELACEYRDYLYGYQPRCEKCQEKKNKEEEKRVEEMEKKGVKTKRKKGPAILGRYEEAVAFGYDKKTGRRVAINEKGKRVDPSKTRYDIRADPRGWKAIGKKVRERDEFGHRTNR